MKNKICSAAFNITDAAVKCILIGFLVLFAFCIFIKSKLVLTPVTLIALVLFVCVIAASKFKPRRFGVWLIFIFAIAFALRVMFIKIWPIEPLSDCKTGYIFTEQLNNTAISAWHEVFAANKYYYDVWPMHVPYMIYQTICMRILGNSLFALQIVNMFFSALTCVFVAICAEGLTKSKRAGIVAGLFMAFNVTTLFMACFLVNQHISTCFFVASLCLIVKKPFSKDFINYILAGLLLAAGHLMRPEMTIVLVALWCMIIYEIIKTASSKTEKKLKDFGRIIVGGLAFTLAFLVVIYSANAVLLGLRWVKNPITESKLEYKLMIGLNRETEGRFQDSDYPLAANDIAVKEVLAERISSPAETAVLMIKKLCFQFSSYNYWWLQADKGGTLRQYVINNIFEPITQSYMFFIMALAITALIVLFKRKDGRIALLCAVYIGFMCALALMEVQQRYAYITIPVLTILAATLFRKRNSKKH